LAAVRVPRGQSGARSEPDTPLVGGASAPRSVREVRHVALLSLRVDGIDELRAALGVLEARARFEAIRAILGDIAYKRGAVMSWTPETELVPSGIAVARAVVGLLGNPSRAAADAAWLAVDVHEALAGATIDFPAPLRAAIGIVRGIATGYRDAAGHL